EPALTPGRRYAMVVEAQDPLGKAAIRNNGRSEVVVFTYGENQALAGLSDNEEDATPVRQPQQRADEEVPEKAFGTHTVRGTLKWAFREQEHQYATTVKRQQGNERNREMLANRQADLGVSVVTTGNTSL